MPKMQEYDQRSIASWLSSDLGQTLPEFSTEDTAGYGERRRRFVPVKSVTVVRPTGFLNPRSDEYSRVATFLQADLKQVKAAMEKKTYQLPKSEADRKQFYANVQSIQTKLGEFMNRADAALKKLTAEKNKLSVSKAFMRIASGAGVNALPAYTARVQEERTRLNKLYQLKGQDFNNYWLSDNPARYAKMLEELAGHIEDAINAAQIENTQFGLMAFAQEISKQASEILPTPKEIFGYIPWVVGGIALIAFFPLIRSFSAGAAQVQGLGRYRRHW